MYIYEIGACSKYYREGTPDKATIWRQKVDEWADNSSYALAYNPAKTYNPATIHFNRWGRLAVDHNEYFISKCDIAICNLEDIDASPGSIYELTRFKTQSKPVIAFGRPCWSPHISSCISCTVPTLEEALDLINTMFF
jgi:hypothetical protein